MPATDGSSSWVRRIDFSIGLHLLLVGLGAPNWPSRYGLLRVTTMPLYLTIRAASKLRRRSKSAKVVLGALLAATVVLMPYGLFGRILALPLPLRLRWTVTFRALSDSAVARANLGPVRKDSD